MVLYKRDLCWAPWKCPFHGSFSMMFFVEPSTDWSPSIWRALSWCKEPPLIMQRVLWVLMVRYSLLRHPRRTIFFKRQVKEEVTSLKPSGNIKPFCNCSFEDDAQIAAPRKNQPTRIKLDIVRHANDPQSSTLGRKDGPYLCTWLTQQPWL